MPILRPFIKRICGRATSEAWLATISQFFITSMIQCHDTSAMNNFFIPRLFKALVVESISTGVRVCDTNLIQHTFSSCVIFLDLRSIFLPFLSRMSNTLVNPIAVKETLRSYPRFSKVLVHEILSKVYIITQRGPS